MFIVYSKWVFSYEELKMSAQDRSRRSQWRWKPAMAEHYREGIPGGLEVDCN